jgi:hypothetical protein
MQLLCSKMVVWWYLLKNLFPISQRIFQETSIQGLVEDGKELATQKKLFNYNSRLYTKLYSTNMCDEVVIEVKW